MVEANKRKKIFETIQPLKGLSYLVSVDRWNRSQAPSVNLVLLVWFGQALGCHKQCIMYIYIFSLVTDLNFTPSNPFLSLENKTSTRILVINLLFTVQLISVIHTRRFALGHASFSVGLQLIVKCYPTGGACTHAHNPFLRRSLPNLEGYLYSGGIVQMYDCDSPQKARRCCCMACIQIFLFSKRINLTG